jgi:hypothetical protein
MPAQEKRLALNEALFREVNERVEERVRLFHGREELLGIVCECADLDCTQRITVSKDEYATARSEPTHFLVKPGHSVDEAEDIVVKNDRFEIVRKRGLAADIAEFLGEEDTTPP